jgi:N-acetylmuramoyl-L-alanine amidase
MKTVVVDPGHGGADHGAFFEEKGLNLQLALAVRAKLLERCRVKVLLTRTADRTVPPAERNEFARRQKADYYCSIHHSLGDFGFSSYIGKKANHQTKQKHNCLYLKVSEQLSEYDFSHFVNKESDFPFLKKTKVPAARLEFSIDSMTRLDPEFQDHAASAIALGLALALNLPPAEKPLYRVIA